MNDTEWHEENRTFRWSAVVIARDEAARLDSCLRHVVDEMRDIPACLTIIVNGSTDRSAEIARRFVTDSAIPAQAFDIAFGDKSNAWNQFVHTLAPRASAHIFVDGYAYVVPGSFAALSAALDAAPDANAATGLSSGRPNAERLSEVMIREGGLHGSLHALRDTFLRRIRACELRIPVGHYRGDGLIGSFAMHNCDCVQFPWDRRRIAPVPTATWRGPDPSLRQLARHGRRLINQARGKLESRAVRSVIYPGGFGALPRFSDEMLRDYLKLHPEARPAPTDITGRFALRRLTTPRTPSDADLVPRILASTMPEPIALAAHPVTRGV